MIYYNYHGIATKKIREHKLIKYTFVDKWNNISPAMVLFFIDHKPMPIRQEKWDYYYKILKENHYL